MEASSRIFTLLMIGFVGIATSHIFGTLLTANRNLRELNILALSAVIMNLILNLNLIPEYLAYGAAIACLLTQGYMALGQILIAAFRLKLRIPVDFILRISLSVPLILAGGYLTAKYLENWYMGIVLLIVWTGLAAFALRLVRIGDLIKLLPTSEK